MGRTPACSHVQALFLSYSVTLGKPWDLPEPQCLYLHAKWQGLGLAGAGPDTLGAPGHWPCRAVEHEPVLTWEDGGWPRAHPRLEISPRPQMCPTEEAAEG